MFLLKYYCYISQSKVDDLYMQTASGNVEEKETQKKIDLAASAETAKDRLSILSLFGTDLSYGANGAIQFNKKEKVQYARKLNKVLSVLEKEKQLQQLDLKSSHLPSNSLFYYITSKFHVSDRSSVTEDGGYFDGIVQIESGDISDDGIKLSLACSIKYFSDTRSNGKYMIHSGNYYFFKGNAEIEFDTVFVYTYFDADKKTIYGSPLFLAISHDKRRKL